MSDAPSAKLLDGAIKKGGVMGIDAVDDPIKPQASISVPIEREIAQVSEGNSDTTERFKRKLLTLKRQVLNRM